MILSPTPKPFSLSFWWKAINISSFDFISQYALTFTRLVNIENINRIVVLKNGVGVFDGIVMTTPLTIESNDKITIRIYKSDFSSLGKFQLLGST